MKTPSFHLKQSPHEPSEADSLWTLVRRPEAWMLFLLAAFLRFAFAARGIDQLGFEEMFLAAPDARLYMNMAQALLSGSGSVEFGLFTFGPGHALYLASILWLADGNLWAVLLINLALSSSTCVLVYLLASLLLGSRPIAAFAGFVSAVSITGIELSAIALSEIPFVFLFALGNTLYVLGLFRQSYVRVILATACLGAAALIRPIAQFWPIVMVLWAIVLSWPVTGKQASSVWRYIRPRVPLIALAVAIPALIMLSWSARNLAKHDTFALAFSSATGPANVAGMVVSENQDKTYRDVLTFWLDSCRADHSAEHLTIGQRFDCLQSAARAVLLSHPGLALRVYADATWTNINDISYLHRSVLPEDKHLLIELEYKIKNRGLQYLPLALVLVGLGTLLVLGRFRAMFILGSLYLYFALLVGTFLYQGSRLMYPAYLAGDILITIALAGPILLLKESANWQSR